MSARDDHGRIILGKDGSISVYSRTDGVGMLLTLDAKYGMISLIDEHGGELVLDSTGHIIASGFAGSADAERP